MNIESLCSAIKDTLDELKRSGLSFKGHSWVDSFQRILIQKLENTTKKYSWNPEEPKSGRAEGDRVDIFGRAKGQPDWIIEIDATRADQVAKKFLSRLALWGLEEKRSIEYVAVLYPDTQKGKKSCEKYIRYGYDIIQKINKKSNITGIFIDPKNNNDIEVLDYNGSCQFVVNGHDCKSMNAAAAKALSIYLSKHSVHYKELKEYWGRYVLDSRDKSRYKPIDSYTSDSPPQQIYTYTQFRKYGISAYWNDFVRKCKEAKIMIVQKRKLYDGTDESRPFKYMI